MILVDEKTAVMDRGDFTALLEYSLSLPTGTAAGKRWKCHLWEWAPAGVDDRRLQRVARRWLDAWLMGEYLEPDPDGMVPIHWRELVVVD